MEYLQEASIILKDKPCFPADFASNHSNHSNISLKNRIQNLKAPQRHRVELGLPQGVVRGLDEEIGGNWCPHAARHQQAQVLAVDPRCFEEGTSRLSQDHPSRARIRWGSDGDQPGCLLPNLGMTNSSAWYR